jgi:hypothetical protein
MDKLRSSLEKIETNSIEPKKEKSKKYFGILDKLITASIFMIFLVCLFFSTTVFVSAANSFTIYQCMALLFALPTEVSGNGERIIAYRCRVRAVRDLIAVPQ